MRGIAEERHSAVHPPGIREDVVHVASLHVLRLGALQTLENRGAPAGEPVHEHGAVVGPALALGELVVAPGWNVEEGVVLLLTRADVGGDEVLLRAEEHLIARAFDVRVHSCPVRGGVIANGGVNRVSGVSQRRILRVLVTHLRPHLGPDAVRADEHVPFISGAVGEGGDHLVPDVFVLLHDGLHHDVFLADGVAKDVEEVVPRDDEGERETVVVARLAGVEPVEPVPEDAVEEAVDAVAGDCGFLPHLLQHVGRDGIERALRVALELDGASEELVLLHLLEHLDLHAAALQGERGDESGDASAGDEDGGEIVPGRLLLEDSADAVFSHGGGELEDLGARRPGADRRADGCGLGLGPERVTASELARDGARGGGGRGGHDVQR